MAAADQLLLPQRPLQLALARALIALQHRLGVLPPTQITQDYWGAPPSIPLRTSPVGRASRGRSRPRCRLRVRPSATSPASGGENTALTRLNRGTDPGGGSIGQQRRPSLMSRRTRAQGTESVGNWPLLVAAAIWSCRRLRDPDFLVHELPEVDVPCDVVCRLEERRNRVWVSKRRWRRGRLGGLPTPHRRLQELPRASITRSAAAINASA